MILYTENIRPVYFRPIYQLANLRLDELHWLRLSLFKHHIVWAKSKPGRKFAREEGRKLHGAKVVLKTV